MKPASGILSLFLLAAPAFSQTAKTTISDLSWLKGCWTSSVNGKEISEHWMKPSGQTMLGMSRTVSGDKTVAFEFLQIRQDEKGDIHYVAKPSGQAEASFKLVKLGKAEAVFENPQHDFPQRIIYRLEPGGALVARIEGMSKGKPRASDFPYKKASCE